MPFNCFCKNVFFQEDESKRNKLSPKDQESFCTSKLTVLDWLVLVGVSLDIGLHSFGIIAPTFARVYWMSGIEWSRHFKIQVLCNFGERSCP
jgi:hypothetical protein